MIETEFVQAPNPEIYGSQPCLGRLPAIDERSKAPRFAMAAPPSARFYRNWLSPEWREWPRILDQGNTAHCVAYSCTKYLLTHPIVNRPIEKPESFYHRAQL